MADIISKKRRSEIMSHIKSKNTTIELLVRRKLFSLGYRYRVNFTDLFGKPDIVFTKKRIAIFIHGCFWHGHEVNCRYTHESKSNAEYWKRKIDKNKDRDKANYEKLTALGWIVIIIWECEIKKNFDYTINRLVSVLEQP